MRPCSPFPTFVRFLPVVTLFAALWLLFVDPYPASAQELPAVLIQQGERYLAMGKYEAALSRYGKVLACCEGTKEAAEAHSDMGVAQMRLGNVEEAQRHYEAALRINRYPLALFNYARLLEQRWKDDGHDADRQTALEYYKEFSLYLEKGENLPPVVEYQKDELQEHLRDSLAALQKP